MSSAETCDLVVVCYDIAHDKRRTRIARALEGYGLRVQESVFECWLTPGQLRTLRQKLTKLMDQGEDRIACYTLRPTDRQDFRSLGRSPGLSADFTCGIF
jgi:CRISPR-associated protein Cas2